MQLKQSNAKTAMQFIIFKFDSPLFLSLCKIPKRISEWDHFHGNGEPSFFFLHSHTCAVILVRSVFCNNQKP